MLLNKFGYQVTYCSTSRSGPLLKNDEFQRTCKRTIQCSTR